MTPDAYLAQLARLQSAFAALAADVDPEAVVPGLDGWRVRELVAHLAGVHRWAAGMAEGDPTRDQEPGVGALDAPELAALYAEHAADLRATLAAVGPDGAALTLVGPGAASFWFRRQVHETLVHLGDLAAARAGAWTPDVLDGVVDLEPEVWADGVDEVVTMFEPRQVRLGRIAPLARLVALRDADGAARWVLGAHEDGRDPAGSPAATVTGDARALDLVLWRRVSPAAAGVTVDGDAAALDAALAAGITP
ncbi:maleylpyruvate isomerase N-terminal domain-containing protein [Xylanimonas protaetiae]|uniref:Maleylpyruvate isomerase family mycothiol-dependent enzyme n=1 Tax=Xylanimonas protaetiae TaxID=2509457 RepID=A0A4P6F742_9MICO|nr:maleylpyruvate isomerase N-terminal domain-containing protein [Xylanimonas protaetiae]QAY71494.1 maleylpyruvate isomerase family mycothiol-dependent enzyme [Xylanimonas protaetiae]